MPRPTTTVLAGLAAVAAAAIALPAFAGPRGDAWWHHIEVLAADDMRGRATGSADYLRAAAYVVGRFRALGLEPAGTDGWFQPVAFVEQTVDQKASRAALVGADGRRHALEAPRDIIFGGGVAAAPPTIHAPIVFAGYGLHLPELGHDDFAGLDVRGKVVAVLSGGPATLPGPAKSDARNARAKYLAAHGAVGILSLTTVKQIEIPWDRRMRLASQPAMYLADPALRETAAPLAGMQLDTAGAERLFEGSGHDFAELSALADASAPVPTFGLAVSLDATIAATRRDVTSPNILARLPGSDPALAGETVTISAHLDHLGVGEAIGGDRIYNGAMDNASGVANLLEIAAKLRADDARPGRSILFAVVTAEEKGLLGSRYLAERPPARAGRIVADLNFDMPLPLFPLRSVIVLGADESSLGVAARAVGAARGLPLAPDPLPDRNAFIRSDQYSFIRAGVPAVAFKFGFAKDTPEFQIEHDWRATRYHAPSDDLGQPVERDEAVKLNDYVAALALRIADDPARPRWNAGSRFARAAR